MMDLSRVGTKTYGYLTLISQNRQQLWLWQMYGIYSDSDKNLNLDTSYRQLHYKKISSKKMFFFLSKCWFQYFGKCTDFPGFFLRASKGNTMRISCFWQSKTITARNFRLRQSYKLIFSGSKVPDSTISWQNMSYQLARTFELHPLSDFHKILKLLKECTQTQCKSEMSKKSHF